MPQSPSLFPRRTQSFTHVLAHRVRELFRLNRPWGSSRRGARRQRPFAVSAEVLENRALLSVVSIGDVVLNEGNAGNTTFTFTVTLETALTEDVTFDFETIADTATASSDFTANTGSGTIVAGQTSTTIVVNVQGDAIVELNEQFLVELSNLDANGLPVVFDAPRSIALTPNLVEGGDVVDGGFKLSPNGQFAVYTADQNTNGTFELFSVPTAGGTPVRLNATLPGGGQVERNFQITPDGQTVIYYASQNTENVFELFAVPIAGGNPVRLSPPLAAGEGIFPNFQISPDGESVLFVADLNENDVFELFAVSIDDGAVMKLSGDLVENGDVDGEGFQFSADGDTVVYRADQTVDGKFELFAVAITGGTVTALTPDLPADGDVEQDFQISPDGQTVVYRADQLTEGVIELFAAPITGGPGNSVRLNPALAAGQEVRTGFQITPDGMQVVYTADQLTDDLFELFAVGIDGSLPAVRLNPDLVAGGDVQLRFQITPNSQTVVYSADQLTDDLVELFAVPVDGSGTSTRLNADLPAEGDVLADFQITPNGQTVIYAADQNTNNVTELFAVSILGGLPRQLNSDLVAGGNVTSRVDGTTNEVFPGFQVSADGQTVIYRADQTTDDEFELFAVSLAPTLEATGTITNDEQATLTVTNVSREEGHAGPTSYTFTVTLSHAVDVAVSVGFATANGTATTGNSDYVATDGTRSFNATVAGETKTIVVTVNGDDTVEADESFMLNLMNLAAGGRGITLVNGTGAILNDEALVLIGAGYLGGRGVRGFHAVTGREIYDFLAFNDANAENYFGGVRVASGDINGDGAADIITARGIGGAPEIQVFDGLTGTLFTNEFASLLVYEAAFTNGIFVASGDLNNDGFDDIVTSAGYFGGTHVRAYSGATGEILTDGADWSDFFAGLGKDYRGGAYVAVGDLNSDGHADVIVGAGSFGPTSAQIGPRVRAFSGENQSELADFLAYEATFFGGVFVAAADMDQDGRAEIITGRGLGSGAQIQVFDAETEQRVASFNPFNAPGFTGAVLVAAADVNNDGTFDIIASADTGNGAELRLINGVTQQPINNTFPVFDPHQGPVLLGTTPTREVLSLPNPAPQGLLFVPPESSANDESPSDENDETPNDSSSPDEALDAVFSDEELQSDLETIGT